MLGPLIADVAGHTLTEADRDLLVHPLLGGVILFTRNYDNPTQLYELVQSIKALPRSQPLLISVDHEGGRVQRFRRGFTHLPAMAELGKLYDRHPAQACQQAQQLGWLLAAELLVYGIDYSYAPVLDIDMGVSEVIGDRAFHRTAQGIAQLTSAFIDGMHQAGMRATGKHFPGHGAVQADSHVAIPIDHRQFDEIWQHDLLPYQALIEAHQLDAIMTAHVIYPTIDPNTPCFSPFWLQQVLRERLQFQGVIVSDDLTMAGAATVGDYPRRAELALQAGCDMLLVCNNRPAVIEILDHLTQQSYRIDPLAAARIDTLYGESDIKKEDLPSHPHWQAAQSTLTSLLD